ncbi:MAG: multicopper oxidase family protein [Rhodobacteraceae bacterium]|nr:multicopper oxidase family protein [Paracoccaceae bacterium]
MMNRREFLGGAATTGVAGVLAGMGHAATGPVTLTAKPVMVQLAPPDLPPTGIWGYDGQLPGPVIRARQGERVVRRFINALPQPSSVHWHGLRIENAMDGVAGLTQDAVPTGGEFDYDFTAADAGTFWFHAHNQSVEQVARGLYGALIVEEPDAPDADRDEVLILDDFLLDGETAQIDPDFTSAHDRSHAGRRGNFNVTNGRYDFSLPVKRHERLRLRLINAANARIFQLGLVGMTGWVMAHDGMPLATPEPIEGAFLLAPGQRVDLLADIIAEDGESAHLVRIDDGQGYSQAAFPVVGVAARNPRQAPDAFPPNPDMEITGLAEARRLRLAMEGGAMGGLKTAILNGERMTFRQLAEANQFWSFNGVVGLTDAPLASASRGETLRLEIVNDTAFPHAMHLHGIHFREVSASGSLGPMRDTVLLFAGETREIVFAASHPGKWLFHCHMLSHTASGMATWIEVT